MLRIKFIAKSEETDKKIPDLSGVSRMADLSCSTRRGRRLKPRAWDYSDSCRILRDHDVILEEETGISSLGGENKILCKQREGIGRTSRMLSPMKRGDLKRPSCNHRVQ